MRSLRRGRRRLAVKLTITVTDARGNAATITRNLTLKR